MIKVAVIGTFPPILTGQSIMTEEVLRILGANAVKVNTSRYGLRSLRSFVYSIIKAFLIIKKVETIYFTPSRTIAGSIRDAVIIILGRVRGARLVAHLHGLDFGNLLCDNGLWSVVMIKLYSRVEFILLFEGMEEQLEFLENPVYYIIPNCCSEVEFESIKTESRNRNFEQITYLSNIMATKGIFEFLDLTEELLERREGLRVKIAGSIMSDPELSFTDTKERFYDRLKCLEARFDGRIEYLGQVKGISKINLLRDTKILIFPSRYSMEAQPLVLIEALFFGIQLVFRDHNFLKNQFESDGNYCSLAIEAKEMCSYIDKSDYEKISKDNRRLAVEKFSHERFRVAVRKVLLNE